MIGSPSTFRLYSAPLNLACTVLLQSITENRLINKQNTGCTLILVYSQYSAMLWVVLDVGLIRGSLILPLSFYEIRSAFYHRTFKLSSFSPVTPSVPGNARRPYQDLRSPLSVPRRSGCSPALPYRPRPWCWAGRRTRRFGMCLPLFRQTGKSPAQ